MANYFIIGGDGKQYGPVTETDVRQWIVESRLAGHSLAKAEGGADFRPLSAFPEFSDAFTAAAPTVTAPPSSGYSDSFRSGVSGGDYHLDIGGCISGGWNLLKNNMSVLFVVTLLYLLIEVALSGISELPVIGVVASIASFIIAGPMLGGIFGVFIKVNRNETADIGNMFDGFRRSFGHLFLANLVITFIIGACLIPFFLVYAVKFMDLLRQIHPGQAPDKETVRAIMNLFLHSLPVLLLCMIPITYLSVCWQFTLPLIMDRQMGFWTAMKTSFKRVNKHWLQVFGLMVVIGLLNIAGILACCVGVLFTLPIGFAALMIAYETIFNES